jgi:hypothetical protein
MKRYLTIIAALILMSLPAAAQTLGLSYSPYGEMSIKCPDGVYYYSSSLAGGVTYEFLTDGDSIMLEGVYSVYKFDTFGSSPEHMVPLTTENMSVMSLMAYYGWTINKRKRIQFPIYAGLGICSFEKSPGPKTALAAGLKARVKFYVSNRFGIFAGANASYGIFGVENSGSNQIDMYPFKPMSVEFGLMFDLLDKK